MSKIGILVPATSRGRDWKNIKDTYLYNIFLKSFFTTYSKEHSYTIYLIIDPDDPVFDTEESKSYINKFLSLMQNTSLKILYSTNINKGHVTEMWNKCFHTAYNDGCDYFYQCGDDVQFLTKNWVNIAIKLLKKHNDIGVTGPLDGGRINCTKFILTQTFVSRKHMEIIKNYFPPEIINWFCDDWITYLYYPKYLYKMNGYYIQNIGGKPRYDVVGEQGEAWQKMTQKTMDLIKEAMPKLVTLVENYTKD